MSQKQYFTQTDPRHKFIEEFSHSDSIKHQTLKITQNHTSRLAAFIQRHKPELGEYSNQHSNSSLDATKPSEPDSYDLNEDIKKLDTKLISKKIKVSNLFSPVMSRSVSPNPSIMRTPKDFLADIKGLKETLKAEISPSTYSAKGGSYSAFMLLKKAYDKLEGLEMLSKTLDLKKIQLESQEKDLKQRAKKVNEKEQELIDLEITHDKIEQLELLLAERELQIKEHLRYIEKREAELYETERKLSLETLDQVNKKLSFEENIDNQSFEVFRDISTPGFPLQNLFKNQESYSKLETELRSTAAELEKRTYDLLKLESELSQRESSIHDQQKSLFSIETELRLRENKIIISEKDLRKNLEELENLKKAKQDQICKLVIDELVQKTVTLALEGQSQQLETVKFEHQIAAEKIENQFEELNRYKEKLDLEAAKQLIAKQELERQEDDLSLQESRIAEQVKLLGEGKEDEILTQKETYLSEREKSLRAKHLKLLEIQEALKEKEQELVLKEKEMKTVILDVSFNDKAKNNSDKDLEMAEKMKNFDIREKNLQIKEKLLEDQEIAIEHKRKNVIVGWENVLKKFQGLQKNDEENALDEMTRLKNMEKSLEEREAELHHRAKSLEVIERSLKPNLDELKAREEVIATREVQFKDKQLSLITKEKYLDSKVKEVKSLILQISDHFKRASPIQSRYQNEDMFDIDFETCQADNRLRLSKILYEL